ncbi:hypothetical protein FisN_5Lh288 [Fistulifera solaris]|uniref:DUF445 domain-containing protein n=1 Tax=Fistulifera solaris TaxID=1519565 RepID=A0A1Z5KG75_FISSO|nr:hypothetical protein FisN_5Lh288 [Fistulifera solaris]|eukprot:GAX25206.1 hypothetical protein FisN_5Lh288 [Fistulifera solaris]
MIPLIAAFVGWFTNWLAVQMIFYPIEFRGIPLYRRQEVPLGLLGWQGIIPCKTRPMTEAMVHMVTSQLLSVKDAFARLDPGQVANLLAPEVPALTRSVLKDVAPGWLTGRPAVLMSGLGGISQGAVRHLNIEFLRQLTISIQANIDTVFNLQNCVVNQMLQDRSKLGILFRKCGQKELDFLTNSGLWFGFLLGIIQMVVALFWENPWSLSIGGGIVGLATNWLALKWIFQPVDPVSLGPFGTIQGMFLRRQKEVAQEFSSYFANNVLNAEQLWKSVLTDLETKPAFAALFRDHVERFLSKLTFGTMLGLKPETISSWSNAAIEKLPQHVPVTYSYMDNQLGLQDTLRVRMERMTSRQFERVLHPIFEEDELTCDPIPIKKTTMDLVSTSNTKTSATLSK